MQNELPYRYCIFFSRGDAYWGGAVIRDKLLFRKSSFLKGRSLAGGAYQRVAAH